MRLSESKIDNIIRKVVGKSLNEAADYDDNDLEYWSIVSQADAAVDRLEREGNVSYGWKDVAEKMGFRLETLNDADLELIKDAIEQAMLDANDDYWSKDAEFENDFRNMKTESRRRRRLGESELRNIVKSSIKETLLREWGEDKEKVTEESNQDVITLYDLLKELQTKLLGSNINKRFLPKPSYAANWYKLGDVEMDEFGFPTVIVSNRKYYSPEDGSSHAERVVSALINKHNLNVGYNTNKFGDVKVYSKGRRWKAVED